MCVTPISRTRLKVPFMTNIAQKQIPSLRLYDRHTSSLLSKSSSKDFDKNTDPCWTPTLPRRPVVVKPRSPARFVRDPAGQKGRALLLGL